MESVGEARVSHRLRLEQLESVDHEGRVLAHVELFWSRDCTDEPVHFLPEVVQKLQGLDRLRGEVFLDLLEDRDEVLRKVLRGLVEDLEKPLELGDDFQVALLQPGGQLFGEEDHALLDQIVTYELPGLVALLEEDYQVVRVHQRGLFLEEQVQGLQRQVQQVVVEAFRQVPGALDDVAKAPLGALLQVFLGEASIRRAGTAGR